MKIRWSIVLLAAFGIVAALAAAVLTASLSAGQIQAVMPAAPEDVTILLASREFKAMTRIDMDAIVTKKVSPDDAPGQYYSDPSQIVGKVLSLPMIEGQAFTKVCFPQPGSGLDLAFYLPLGKRAVNVSLEDYSGLQGLLYPGCSVDVLASFRISSDSKIGRAVSSTLLQNIEVIAVENLTVVSNSEILEATGATSRSSRNRLLVTLMVDSRQAEALQLAMEHGAISLAMRNPTDVSIYQSDATLLSDGMLAALADVLMASVPAEVPKASSEVELAAIESDAIGSGDASTVEVVKSSNDSTDIGGDRDVVVAAAQYRESISTKPAPKTSATVSKKSRNWSIEVIRGLVSDNEIVKDQN